MEKLFLFKAASFYEVFEWDTRTLVGVIRSRDGGWVIEVDKGWHGDVSEGLAFQVTIILRVLNKLGEIPAGPFVAGDHVGHW